MLLRTVGLSLIIFKVKLTRSLLPQYMPSMYSKCVMLLQSVFGEKISSVSEWIYSAGKELFPTGSLFKFWNLKVLTLAMKLMTSKKEINAVI